MLGDAAGLAGDDMGLADRVEQRGLAVVDMAHDGDDGRTRLQRLVGVGRVEQAFLDVGFGDALDGVAHLLGDELGGVGVDHVGDLVHRALLHQQADDVDAALRHAVGEFLDGDRLGDDHLAHHALLGDVRGAVPGHALDAAAEGRDRACPLVVAAGRGRQRQAAARLLADLRGLGRRRRRAAGRAAGTTAGTAEGGPRLAVIGTAARGCGGRSLPRRPDHGGLGRRGRVDGPRRARGVEARRARIQTRRPCADIAHRGARRELARRRRRPGGAPGHDAAAGAAAAGAARGVGLRGRRDLARRLGRAGLLLIHALARGAFDAALALVFLAAALLLLALAGEGRFTLLALALLAQGALAGLFLGDPAGLGLAASRVGEGALARILFLVGERAQQHARCGPRRGRRRRRGRGPRSRLLDLRLRGAGDRLLLDLGSGERAA